MANILGTKNNDILNGTASDDTIWGLEGADSIIASDGNDTIDGERVFQSDVAVTIPFSSAIGGLFGVTINSSQVMTFFTDSLVGGVGNDTYIINHGGVIDIVTEQSNQGIDTVQSFVNYTLTDNVENLTLLDDQIVSVTYSNLQVTMLGAMAPTSLNTLYVSTAIQGTGNTLDNVITGNTKNNLLKGLDGNDILKGAAGNDTLEGGEGTDTAVYTGNWSKYTVNGTVANATVTGLEGTDSLLGIESLSFNGYVVSLADAINDAPVAVDDSNINDEVVEADVIASGDSTATGNILQNDTDADSVLFADETKKVSKVMGLSANVGVVLEGVYGSIQILEQGNYIYTLNNNDSDTEALNTGQVAIDSFTYSVIDAHGAESTAVLNISIEGSNDISTSPTEGDDVIYGDQDTADYNDYIDALGGNDIVYGLTQDDTLVGGSGNDQLYGNTGYDILDGGTGIDSLVGGEGHDSYLVDDSADVITEVLGEGHDAVTSTVTYTLSANTEDLTLDGIANINGTGNDLNNLIIGNNGNNILDGGVGADALLGVDGNDIYIIDNVLDGATENANQGIDTVLASVNYTLGNNIENLTLQGSTNLTGTGNSLHNIITGNMGNNTLSAGVGNDTLDGGLGVDVLSGGAGNDLYYIDNVGDDVINESATGGTDTILSNVTYSLYNRYVENLSLTGTDNTKVTGNNLNNVLIGNSGNNTLSGGTGSDTLDGGLGADILSGGEGNDLYYVDNVSDDVINESVAGGTDTILSNVTYSLYNRYVENLTLTGTGNVNAAGNNLNNVLTGNSGNNTLSGGTGNDTYVFGVGGGQDLITDVSGTADVLSILSGVTEEQLWFKKVGNNLEVSIVGTTDKVTVNNWYVGGTAQVEQIRTATGDVLASSQVQNLVAAMSSFSPPPVGTTTLDSGTYASVLGVIAANWT